MASTTLAAIIPTVYHARGLVVDTRLHVLDVGIYHVSSVVLKLNSRFFDRFNNSPDKADAMPIQGGLQYEWATKYDTDGTWSLVAVKDGNVRFSKT